MPEANVAIALQRRPALIMGCFAGLLPRSQTRVRKNFAAASRRKSRIGAVTLLERLAVDVLPRAACAAGRHRGRSAQPAGRRPGARPPATWPWCPSIEYLRNPGCTIVSDACIASDGPVRSVMLYSRVPPERIGSLALDEGSRTSAALVRIWLAGRFGCRPAARAAPHRHGAGDCTADAVMLIGDRGMRPLRGDFEFAWDLGEEWRRWTGLPFVFALWVARPGVRVGRAGRGLGGGPRRGPDRLRGDRPAAAPVVGIPEAECLSYLRDHLEFRLGARQRQGLDRFFRVGRPAWAGACRRSEEPSIVFHDRNVAR